MDRRQYLTALGATAGAVGVAGCLGSGNSGETIVDGVAGEDWERGHEFDAEAGDTIRVDAPESVDSAQYFDIVGRNDGAEGGLPVLTGRTDIADEFSVTLTEGGAYAVLSGGEGATITVTIE